jgi:glycosyltransferase involved in cell wall biosynthesis
MRILIAAISFSSKMSGIQRHAFNLVRCLLAHPDISEVHLVVAPWQRDGDDVAPRGNARLKIHIASVKPNPLSRNLWHYSGLAKLGGQIQPDCIHLSFPVPFDPETLGCPVALTLHDLYPYEIPANFHFPHVVLNRLILQQSLRRADAIACVSDTTLSRLSQYTPEHVWRRAVRIYNCVEPITCEVANKPLPELQGSFLLCVAQHRRNKNLPLLIRAFRSLLDRRAINPETNLLVVGIPGPETARLHSLVAELSLNTRVLFADGLPDSSLQWCYTHCDALIVPSIT